MKRVFCEMSFGELSFCEMSHGEMGFCELSGHPCTTVAGMLLLGVSLSFFTKVLSFANVVDVTKPRAPLKVQRRRIHMRRPRVEVMGSQQLTIRTPRPTRGEEEENKAPRFVGSWNEPLLLIA